MVKIGLCFLEALLLTWGKCLFNKKVSGETDRLTSNWTLVSLLATFLSYHFMNDSLVNKSYFNTFLIICGMVFIIYIIANTQLKRDTKIKLEGLGMKVIAENNEEKEKEE